MSTIWSFDAIKTKHDVCIEMHKDCIKRFCKSLKGHAMEIIKFEKKEDDTINRQTVPII